MKLLLSNKLIQEDEGLVGGGMQKSSSTLVSIVWSYYYQINWLQEDEGLVGGGMQKSSSTLVSIVEATIYQVIWMQQELLGETCRVQ